MGKYSLRVALSLLVTVILMGTWFWVLYNEEHRRLTRAAEREALYFDELKSIDSERKLYFEKITATRKEQVEAMEAAKAQYEELLKSQPNQITSAATATKQVVNKPVTKQETVKVAKPKSTRKSKSS